MYPKTSGHKSSADGGNAKIGGGKAKSFGDASDKKTNTSGGKSAKSATKFKTH